MRKNVNAAVQETAAPAPSINVVNNAPAQDAAPVVAQDAPAVENVVPLAAQGAQDAAPVVPAAPVAQDAPAVDEGKPADVPAADAPAQGAQDAPAQADGVAFVEDADITEISADEYAAAQADGRALDALAGSRKGYCNALALDVLRFGVASPYYKGMALRIIKSRATLPTSAAFAELSDKEKARRIEKAAADEFARIPAATLENGVLFGLCTHPAALFGYFRAYCSAIYEGNKVIAAQRAPLAVAVADIKPAALATRRASDSYAEYTHDGVVYATTKANAKVIKAAADAQAAAAKEKAQADAKAAAAADIAAAALAAAQAAPADAVAQATAKAAAQAAADARAAADAVAAPVVSCRPLDLGAKAEKPAAIIKGKKDAPARLAAVWYGTAENGARCIFTMRTADRMSHARALPIIQYVVNCKAIAAQAAKACGQKGTADLFALADAAAQDAAEKMAAALNIGISAVSVRRMAEKPAKAAQDATPADGKPAQDATGTKGGHVEGTPTQRPADAPAAPSSTAQGTTAQDAAAASLPANNEKPAETAAQATAQAKAENAAEICRLLTEKGVSAAVVAATMAEMLK